MFTPSPALPRSIPLSLPPQCCVPHTSPPQKKIKTHLCFSNILGLWSSTEIWSICQGLHSLRKVSFPFSAANNQHSLHAWGRGLPNCSLHCGIWCDLGLHRFCGVVISESHVWLSCCVQQSFGRAFSVIWSSRWISCMHCAWVITPLADFQSGRNNCEWGFYSISSPPLLYLLFCLGPFWIWKDSF